VTWERLLFSCNADFTARYILSSRALNDLSFINNESFQRS
jgi:hypothetical protein